MKWEIRLVHRADETPVIVDAGDHACVAQLRRAIAATRSGEVGVLVLNGRTLSDELPLAAVGLVTGAGLHVDPHPAALRPAAVRAAEADLELAVVGGLAAGHAVPVPVGATVTIGRGTDCELTVHDPEVSRHHVRVSAAGGGAVLTDLGSRNGTGAHGFRIDGATELAEHDAFQLGETVVALRSHGHTPARLERSGEQGVVRFNRPPRIRRPTPRPEVSVPARPQPPHGFRFPVLAVLLPLLAAGALYLLLPGSAYFLIFLVLSPIMLIANAISDRRNGRNEYKAKLLEYEQGLAAARTRLAELAVAEERTGRRELPDPAAVVRIGTEPASRLFERRLGDQDFLRLRVGLADRPADIALTGPGAENEQPPTVHAVPVTVDLAGAGVLGVAGPRALTLPLARALLSQVATLHAPHDVGIVLLTGTDEVPDWGWLSWLPHTLPHTSDMTSRRMVASTLEQAEARITELAKVVSRRRDEQRAVLRDGTPLGRRLILLLDGARRLRGLAGLADLLADGPRVGVYALCLDTAESSLPDECQATVVAASATRVRVSRPDTQPRDDVLAEGLTAELAATLATALAPIRVLGARLGDDGDLPDVVRFLDLAGLGPDPTPDDIRTAWQARPGGRCTTVRIGVGPNGPVEIDLRRDGPHGLIAGTSGAGKSELLQSLVAGLALGNSPDALNIMLVDYKGGSAFAECAQLPHCVGMITDLDGHLVNRALASLSAELRRREALLAEAGTKNIEDYWAGTGARLPRLVIVIDEFASLIEEVPEFITGVVGIGMRGRSLGVHVVLATQRPGGVVNAELRANVNLRMCLRVTSGAESSDVIDTPDAARISKNHPGRSYLRTGHGDLAMLQCARVGWPRREAAASNSDTVTVVPRSLAGLGHGRAAGPGQGRVQQAETPDGYEGPTDLTVLVAAIGAAAEQAGITAPPGPWLPPLPGRVSVEELAPADPEFPVSVVLGLADHPTHQAQLPFVLDLDQTGPVVVAGMARSGRSTVLRTLAAGLAARTSPADVHLYALDCGSRALASLTALPHCGAWVGADDLDRTPRLLALLTAELERRQRLLAAGGFGSVREQWGAARTADRLPYLILLIDQYEAFLARYQEIDGGQLVDTLDGLLRQGAAAGLLPVLSTDRTGFTHRLSTVAATRIVLRQAHVDDVAVYGMAPRDVPGAMPPGRAVVLPAGVEVQVALIGPDSAGAGETTAVERLAGLLRRRWDEVVPARLPRRLDPLPATVTAAEVQKLRVTDPPTAWAACTIGVGGDHLAPVDIDLAEAGGTFLVCGPQGAGRSTALMTVVGSLVGRANGELSVIVVCPRPSPLRRLAGLAGVSAVVTGGASADLRVELDDALAFAGMPVAVVVDDAELLADDPAAPLLERLVRDARDAGSLVIAAGTTEDLLVARYRGWLAAARRSRCGLLLNPASYVDGEVFDLKLPRSTAGGWPPGRGLLVRRGSTLAIQVPALANTESVSSPLLRA